MPPSHMTTSRRLRRHEVAWHDGRTFYACLCGARDECTGDAPGSLPCWECRTRTMRQWVPPAVACDRAAALT